ncbi:MAG: hypothetical protein R3E65_05895 [Steroidobacteraceae bacterium]
MPMHSGQVSDRTPLFVVSGMFGNVLNLGRTCLARRRPFYTLQARGLYGDLRAAPETFREMARDTSPRSA